MAGRMIDEWAGRRKGGEERKEGRQKGKREEMTGGKNVAVKYICIIYFIFIFY